MRALSMGGAALLLAALAACSNEAREVGPSLPQTPPSGNADPRIPAYQANFYQLSQGGRYFAWYGCSGCHAGTSTGALNLADGRWQSGSGFADVFAAIATSHPGSAYQDRIPVEQRWQMTAYIRDLPHHTAEKRRRGHLDQKSEPEGTLWSGPQ